jgi:hypothetical protein
MKTTFFSLLIILSNHVFGQNVKLPNHKEVIEILKSEVKEKMEK